jgi:hypothetical protein
MQGYLAGNVLRGNKNPMIFGVNYWNKGMLE